MTMRFRRALEPKDLATTKRNYYNTDVLKISTLEESLATAELFLTSDYTSPVHVEETPAAGQMLMLSTGATRSVSRRLHLFILLLLASSSHVLHAQVISCPCSPSVTLLSVTLECWCFVGQTTDHRLYYGGVHVRPLHYRTTGCTTEESMSDPSITGPQAVLRRSPCQTPPLQDHRLYYGGVHVRLLHYRTTGCTTEESMSDPSITGPQAVLRRSPCQTPPLQDHRLYYGGVHVRPLHYRTTGCTTEESMSDPSIKGKRVTEILLGFITARCLLNAVHMLRGHISHVGDTPLYLFRNNFPAAQASSRKVSTVAQKVGPG
ncbi:hypothetical protein NHX12_018344 [Muraenolepis orangiensis]|uniref:Uncharacterized protein n=1 Tax=Muraenolepis orangiensis TaxID=630683 RepID=A0A9Q0EWL2_9TELE|nr:hypothetical protein NHX12_018344 [Muraenolepis orangiensis]